MLYDPQGRKIPRASQAELDDCAALSRRMCDAILPYLQKASEVDCPLAMAALAHMVAGITLHFAEEGKEEDAIHTISEAIHLSTVFGARHTAPSPKPQELAFYYARDHEGGSGAWCVRGPSFEMPVPDKLLAYAIGKLLSGDLQAASNAAEDWRKYRAAS